MIALAHAFDPPDDGLDGWSPCDESEFDSPREADPPWLDRIVEPSSDWFSEPPTPHRWLFRDARTPNADGVFPLGKVGLLAAEGGAGKTTALLQIGVAVATGQNALGALSCPAPGRVLLICAEEDVDEVRRRLFNINRSLRTRPPPDGSLVLLPLAGLPCELLRSDASGNIVDAPFLVELRAFLAKSRGPWSLIGIDPLSRFAGSDAERDNFAATRAVAALESLSNQTGAAVLAAHHTSQRARVVGAANASAARGVTGLVDGVRWAATLTCDFVPGLEGDARDHLREVVTMSFVKSNYGRRGAPILLRRDLAHGGVLLPLDVVDRDIIDAARVASDPARRRVSEREGLRQQREAAGEARRAARDRAASERRAAEEAALIATLRERPGIGVVELRASMAARLEGGCGREALVGALARLGGRVRRDPAPRNGVRHFLVGE